MKPDDIATLSSRRLKSEKLRKKFEKYGPGLISNLCVGSDLQDSVEFSAMRHDEQCATDYPAPRDGDPDCVLHAMVFVGYR